MGKEERAEGEEDREDDGGKEEGVDGEADGEEEPEAGK